jgi:hypothetical protein
MHEKILVRAAELVELGWTRRTAARDADGRFDPPWKKVDHWAASPRTAPTQSQVTSSAGS